MAARKYRVKLSDKERQQLLAFALSTDLLDNFVNPDVRKSLDHAKPGDHLDRGPEISCERKSAYE